MVNQPELEQQVSNQDSIDELSLNQEEDNNDELYEKDKLIYDPDEINISTREPTIEQLLRRIDEEALDLAPDFQRHANIWKDEAKSRLIESILIRIPLPAFYIDATDEDKWLVVDGLQRLSALKQFMSDKKLKLCGLEYLTNFEGKTYDEIERRYQRRIQETQVTVYLIEKGTPPEVKYNIFKRINTGGLPMSPQELRHALNPGKATKFLAQLATSDEFLKVTNLSKLRKMRMDDREFILGFLAFRLTSYKDYHSEKRNLFLSKALSKVNNMSEWELQEIKNDFKKAMVAAWEIFGKYAFRKISQNQTKMFPINKALFEVWSVNLSLLSNEEIDIVKQHKEQLIEKFRSHVDRDRDFNASISQAAEKIEYRFRIIEKIIHEVLA
ncbi:MULTISPECIES: DUF262 domain-containing protein [Kamptonema]|uniref:DUF262 domain-containing protein n=1 Tax=Kamptonema TaxID=1501433 RepID=UPI0001DAC46E|nr:MULTISPECIES: DUF262 domain-containing protein [Kamptonema]CBN57924.1 conserved hypothetical protein [Kamptonema sp. PCC 6506]